MCCSAILSPNAKRQQWNALTKEEKYNPPHVHHWHEGTE